MKKIREYLVVICFFLSLTLAAGCGAKESTYKLEVPEDHLVIIQLVEEDRDLYGKAEFYLAPWKKTTKGERIDAVYIPEGEVYVAQAPKGDYYVVIKKDGFGDTNCPLIRIDDEPINIVTIDPVPNSEEPETTESNSGAQESETK